VIVAHPRCNAIEFPRDKDNQPANPPTICLFLQIEIIVDKPSNDVIIITYTFKFLPKRTPFHTFKKSNK